MKAKLKKLWEWFKKLFKRAIVITVDELLDASIDYFMRYYYKYLVDAHGKIKVSATEFLYKLELSIEKKIKDTDNQFDDQFLDIIHDIFQRLDVDGVMRIMEQFENKVEPILRRMKAMIIVSIPSE